MPADDAPMTWAHTLVERVAALREECHGLRRDLEALQQPVEPASVEAERILYATLLSANEAGLVRTMEDVLTVLRHASQPLGPMGADWLARQDRALKREDE